MWVGTDKGKECLNKHFQEMLRDEGIHFEVCRNPDVKLRSWNVLTGRPKFSDILRKTSYRYIDVLP